MQRFYYWVKASDKQVLGRSDTKEYATRMATRYSYDTERFAACDMLVIADFGEDSEMVLSAHEAHPGVACPNLE